MSKRNNSWNEDKIARYYLKAGVVENDKLSAVVNYPRRPFQRASSSPERMEY